jgi:hypothetical protein
MPAPAPEHQHCWQEVTHVGCIDRHTLQVRKPNRDELKARQQRGHAYRQVEEEEIQFRLSNWVSTPAASNPLEAPPKTPRL